jgi:hypothetical protein
MGYEIGDLVTLRKSFSSGGAAVDPATVSNIPVASQRGQEVPVKSDGTTVIAPGDLVERSSTTAGRIVKGSTTPIGIAMSSGAASADVLVKVVLR